MSTQRLIVSANAAPGVGGQGVCLANTLAALTPEFGVSLFAAAPASGAASIVPPRSALARAIGRVPLLRRRRDWTVLAADSAFDRWVARRLPAAALFHGATGQSLRSLEAARRAGMPTVLDVVTLHAEDFAAAARRACARFGARSPFHPRLVRRSVAEYGLADLVRVMSGLARDSLVGRGVPADRIVVAPPPFDLAHFKVARFEHDRFRVAYVGTLEPWKGFDVLVDAFMSLGLKDAELKLWGGTTSRVVAHWLARRMARNPAIAARAVDVAAFGYERVYGEATVLVHPSWTDGFALVVGEAMACGIPVIVTDRTGAADLVRDGLNGYVVPAGNADAIRDRLAHLAQRPALVREMGAAARATMAAYTMERFRAAWVPRVRDMAASGR